MITFKAKESNGEIINSALHAFTFPAGETHIKHTEGRDLQPIEFAILQPSPESLHTDLFHLNMWIDYITRYDYAVYKQNPEYKGTKTALILPYVPGARADRGLPFGLQVYTKFLNELYIDQIIIFDPHSEVTPEFLSGHENLTVVSSDELFELPHINTVLEGYDGIIAPDKGAVRRATNVATLAGLPVHTAEKTRDFETGKLTGFKLDGLPDSGKYLIIDDICDGGGTFLGLAEATGLEYGHIDLYVSHGVFSKNALYNLKQKFEFVYTTNSYDPTRVLNDHGDFGDPDARDTFRVFDVIRLMESKLFAYER